ncbi:valine--tRNA ligase [Ancylomarina euxinus]|uniref:Valine--tRNA ligase n=1 Tax=Ancylomarina euxinus TaxID=2283627 RepID=A0A425XYE4_9BACT|nr:valine--tRNA ligase [Ancylomarina euxinus]MCZ4695801.1 valine--tRNA ligase [Ancylomarina euxinus]MUP16136.1 valine--tRNA ligase [Ancylomarina euxinus]RRG19856.1 valine--tRNA ligase [Ancylomarina euxinus]
MEIPTKYNPAESEDKWYKYWMDKGFFHSVPDEREPYTIVIPPPNVTGVLHMGHMLNNTIQDVLVRRARLQGKNACWVPGTDHASIATEAKVVNKLKQEGISKADITREEFMEHAWEWKEKHGGIILEQLKKLGASCDWDRTAFTMDEGLYESVIDTFIDLYKKDKIYRGVRMVNWDPSAQTAVSDEEVIHKELQSKLYYLRYQVEGSDDYITIATTRPETILGDTAVCINPNDERFAHLRGKRCIVPLVNRSIPIIEDEYVDVEFGTGALKITPAHDINDYQIGDRHNLETIDIFNDNGTMSEAAQLYVGKDRFEVRDLILPDLEKAGNLVKVEDYVNKVGFSERTDAVIEPKLSMQWFLNMKELAEPALEHVMNDDIQLHPAKFKNTYRHWMENVKDWCISRQLWWGQRIPVYYLPEGGYVVAKTIEEALVEATAKTGKTYQAEDLRQDEDVLDTWFSSWLWPLSVFDGIRNPENEEINYYYPTNDLVSGPDILFFWIARMVIAGYEYKGEKPFSNVYLTGIVRDELGRKMSKSLGNSPDPLDLIAKYGADGVRVGMLLCSPAGGDLLFNENLPEQGRNFTTKIWNAFRLVKGWEVADIEQPEYARIATEVFHARLNNTMEQLDEQFKQYRISEALMTVYTLFRDEFSSWYLEMVKPAYQQPIDKKTFDSTVALFEKLMQLLHPFMPFLTEEIWQLLADRSEEDSIMVSVMPKPDSYDANLLAKFEQVKEVIVAVRNIRKQKNIAFKDVLEMNYKAKEDNYDTSFDSVVAKMCNLQEITIANGEMTGAMSFIVNAIEYFIPLGDLVDVEEELKKMEEELKYTQGFLMSVQKKMSNERFVNNAPAKVIEIEKKKMADAEAKIKVLEDRIASMK